MLNAAVRVLAVGIASGLRCRLIYRPLKMVPDQTARPLMSAIAKSAIPVAIMFGRNRNDATASIGTPTLVAAVSYMASRRVWPGPQSTH